MIIVIHKRKSETTADILRKMDISVFWIVHSPGAEELLHKLNILIRTPGNQIYAETSHKRSVRFLYLSVYFLSNLMAYRYS